MSLNIYENGELKKVAGSYKVDSVLSNESKNAVQNKVIKHAIDDKQSKTDAELTTESKEIVGAVNELNKNIMDIHKIAFSTTTKTTNSLGDASLNMGPSTTILSVKINSVDGGDSELIAIPFFITRFGSWWVHIQTSSGVAQADKSVEMIFSYIVN